MHFSTYKAQGYQPPQATLTTPMTTSQVTQAPQTISPPPPQDYTQFAGDSIQGTEMNIQLMSENGPADSAVLTRHSGMCASCCGMYYQVELVDLIA